MEKIAATAVYRVRSQLRAESTKAADLEAKLRVVERQHEAVLAAHAAEKEKLQGDGATASTAARELEERANAAAAEVSSLRAQLAQTAAQLQAENTQSTALQGRVRVCRELWPHKTESLVCAVVVGAAELTAVQAKLASAAEDSSSSIAKLTADKSALTAQVQELRTALQRATDELTSNSTAASERADRLVEQLTELQGKQKLLEVTLQERTEQHRATVERMQAHEEQLRRERNQQCDDMGALQEDIADLRDLVVEVNTQLEAAEQARVAAAARAEAAEAAAGSGSSASKARVAQLEAQLAELRDRVATVTVQLQGAQAKEAAARAQAGQSAAEVSRLVEELNGRAALARSGVCPNCDRLTAENSKLAADLVEYHLKPVFGSHDATAAK